MAITNLPTKLTSAGNQGSAGEYSTAASTVFQIDYSGLDYTPKTTDDYKNDFEEELQVFINGIRIYRTATDTGIDDATVGLNTNQKSRLTNLNSSFGNEPWDIVTSTKIVQINQLHDAFGDSNSNNPGYPDLSTWTIIKVIRIKPDKSSLATDFQSASVLTEAELDNAFSETFHVAQESIDTAQDSMTLGTDNIWDADNKNIKNIATPSGSDPSHYAVNKGYVDGSSTTVTVANNITNVNTVAGISSNVTTVAGISADVTSVANDATDIGAVAGKATEIGRLGTADAVADMAILGTTDVVADLNTLGTADIVADMNLLATSSNVAAMALLGTSDAVADMNTLGTSDVVADMNLLATTDNVSNMDTCADNITNVNAVAGSIAGSQTYTVTVAAYSGSDYFYLDGIKNPTITLTRGFTYTFDQSAGTNSGHLLLFKDSAGNAYTNGVTSSGTLGQAGAKTVFVVPANAPDSLRYYCSSHGNNMGNTITVVNNDLGAVAAVSSNLNLVATNAESNAIEFSIALG